MTESPVAAGDASGSAQARVPARIWPGVDVVRGHGMGRDLVEPDWPPLTDAEVSAVLARYGRAIGPAGIRWRSPRPMSAAALVDCDGAEVFVKRHHVRVRTAGQLVEALVQDADALAHFLHANEVAVIAIAGAANHHIKVVAGVIEIWMFAPEIVLDTATTQIWTR